ncbi:MAG: hypothetical protein KAR06_11455 [Deltaproteobacteria bacterium]|nr:hypothetical protein [Deltaproteobacteria bacterium]
MESAETVKKKLPLDIIVAAIVLVGGDIITGDSVFGFLGIIIFFLVLIVQSIKKNKKVVKVAGVLLIFLVIEVVSISVIKNVEHEKNVETGNVIVTAIERYKKDNGAYPDKLDELRPEYLGSIPKAKFFMFGKRDIHYYYRKGEQAYRLSFEEGFMNFVIFESEKKKWVK